MGLLLLMLLLSPLEWLIGAVVVLIVAFVGALVGVIIAALVLGYIFDKILNDPIGTY